MANTDLWRKTILPESSSIQDAIQVLNNIALKIVLVVVVYILGNVVPVIFPIYAWLAPAGAAKLIGSLVFTYSHRGKEAHSDTWLGLITLGEGFHKAHHDHGNRQILWHRFDIGGQLIRLIDKTA